MTNWPATVAMRTITLYTKLGCHLCEAVEATLAAVGQSRNFTLVRRDISEDPADFEKYKHDIPVILLDGIEIARHRMSKEQLISAL